MDLQKNLREMLKPMNQVSSPTPPRAICASVVPKPFEKFSWKLWPPGALLDAEAGVDRVGIVADARRRFGDDVESRPNPNPAADADDERAVVVDAPRSAACWCCSPRSGAHTPRRDGRASRDITAPIAGE